jgi:hypothetical protein
LNSLDKYQPAPASFTSLLQKIYRATQASDQPNPLKIEELQRYFAVASLRNPPLAHPMLNLSGMTTCSFCSAAQRFDDRRLFKWQTLIVICCGPPVLP